MDKKASSIPQTVLFFAVVNNKLDSLKDYIASKGDLNVKNKMGKTALQIAIEKQRPAFAKTLLENGAHFSPRAEYVKEAMCAAAEKGDADMVQLLISAKAPVDVKNADGQTPLQMARAYGHTEVSHMLMRAQRADLSEQLENAQIFDAIKANDHNAIQKLINSNVSLEATNDEGLTPLQYALSLDLLAPTRILFRYGASILLSDEHLASALVNATKKNNLEMLRLLISVGADIHQPYKNDKPLVQIALESHHADAAQLLLDAKADLDPHAPFVSIIMCYAARTEHADLIRVLLAAKASVDVTNKYENTPLYFAAKNNHTAVMEMLLAADTNTMARANAVYAAAIKEDSQALKTLLRMKVAIDVGPPGFTALERLVKEQNHGAAEILIAAGAKLHPMSPIGYKALWTAVGNGDAKAVRVLLSAKVSTTIPNEQGRRPLDVALAKGHTEVANLLLNPPSAPGKTTNATAQKTAKASSIAVLTPSPSVSPAPSSAVTLFSTKDADVIQELIDAKASVDVKNEDGLTPLQVALRHSFLAPAKVLMKAGARLSPSDTSANPALFTAANSGDADLVQLLVSAKVNVNVSNKVGKTPIQLALQMFHSGAARVLLEAKAEVDPTAEYINNAVISAAVKGEAEVMRLLLAVKAPVETIVDDKGRNPLHVAKAFKQTDVVKLLLKETNIARQEKKNAAAEAAAASAPAPAPAPARAPVPAAAAASAIAAAESPAEEQPHIKVLDKLVQDILAARGSLESRDPQGRTMLAIGVEKRDKNIVSYMINAGAKVDVFDNAGCSPLSYCAVHGQGGVLELLLDAKAPVNAVNKFNQSALYLACQNRHPTIVRDLLSAGADPDICVPAVGTAVSVAAIRGHVDILKKLLHAKASVTIPNSQGRTPLHLAAQFGHAGVAKVLLDAGAPKETLDAGGLSAADVASMMGHLDVYKVLEA